MILLRDLHIAELMLSKVKLIFCLYYFLELFSIEL